MARKKSSPPQDSTSQDVAQQYLRRAILSGELGAGMRVPHAQVARRLGVSGVPVREAMQMLAGEGHLIHVPHKGYYVPRLTRRELIEIYDIRGVLESDAVRAAARLDTARLERLQQLILVMDAAAASEDKVERGRANREFHFLLCGLPDRPLLHRLIVNLMDAANPYRAAYLDAPEHVKKTNDEHRAMLAAATAGDVDRLVDLLHVHRQDALDRLLSLLDEQPSDVEDESDDDTERAPRDQTLATSRAPR